MPLNRLATGVAVLSVAALSVVSSSGSASAVSGSQSSVVSVVPASYTPDVNDGVVYGIGESGSTVVLGGSFTNVSPHGSTTVVPAAGLVAYVAGTGALVSKFHPAVNGTVESVIAGPTPGTVFVGGDFNTIDGESSKIGLISTATGALVPGWKSPSINGEVKTMVFSGGRLYVGGLFTSAGNASHVGLVVVNAASGAVLPLATPAFAGHHNYGVHCDPTTQTCADGGTGLKSIDINPAGTVMVAIGNFTSAGGLARDQIATLDISSASVAVDQGWATDAFTAGCIATAYDSYMRQVEFSPDGTYFVVVDTGADAGQHSNSDGSLDSCDAASRWQTRATGADVRPTWIDYTGNDTLLSVAITGSAVYVGGHERWLNNSNGVDNAGEGAVPRPGLAALDPTNGLPLSWYPGRNPRGAGTYALLATSDGLYAGYDQDYIGNYQYDRKKNAFFPLAGGEKLATNATGALPGTVYLLGGGASAATGRAVPWTGGTAKVSASTLSSVDWTDTRGAFMVNHEVYYGSTEGTFYKRSINGSTFGPAVSIDPYDDPTWAAVPNGSVGTYDGLKSSFYAELPSLTSMFYSAGRVYYTLAGHSELYWRWFEPDSGIVGADENGLVDSIDWSHVAGAFLSGSTLYYADATTGALDQVPFAGGLISGAPKVANTTIDWASAGAFLVSTAATPPPPPAVKPVRFVGASAYDGRARTGSVKVPAVTKAGDKLLLFESYSSTAATATVPAGFTRVGAATRHAKFTTAVFERTAAAGDAGKRLTVRFSASVAASLTLADYASVGGVKLAASALDTGAARHVSPRVSMVGGSLAVTWWTDRSTGTTSWRAPSGVTKRSAVYGTKSAADSSLLVDSGSTVSGRYGGLTAKTNAVDGSGAAWTIALAAR